MYFGLWMRNNWGLWGGSRLSNYFNKLGVFHPDDMSGIILTSYYRYSLGKEIKLEEQISHYKSYWEKVSNRKTIERAKAKSEVVEEELKGYKKGVTIDYDYPYGFSSEQEENYCTINNCFATGKVVDID